MNKKEIVNNLTSKNKVDILETLDFISGHGNKGILENVIELLHQSSDHEICNRIIMILDNLREQDCLQVITSAIQNKRYVNEVSVLISSCWKNSINFEDVPEIFIDVFIDSDFQTAFDALTVIDTFNKIDPEKADLCIVKLKNSKENSKKDKRPLFPELIAILKDLKENPAL